MTTVVNLYKDQCDVRICRGQFGMVPNPPEPGCFGNPFKMEEYGREECIRLFKEYFLKRIAEDQEFKKAVLGLRGKRLGCFCKPKPCHGDVIKEWLDQQGDACEQ